MVKSLESPTYRVIHPLYLGSLILPDCLYELGNLREKIYDFHEIAQMFSTNLINEVKKNASIDIARKTHKQT